MGWNAVGYGMACQATLIFGSVSVCRTDVCVMNLPPFFDAYFYGNVEPVVDTIKGKLREDGFSELLAETSAVRAKAIVARDKKTIERVHAKIHTGGFLGSVSIGSAQ